MPHNSFLFVGTPSDARRLLAHADVLWLGGFDVSQRVAVELRPESSVATDEPSRALVVLLAPSTNAADWLARARSSLAADISQRVAGLEMLADDRVRIELAAPFEWPSVARVAAWAATQPTTHWVEALRPLQYFTR